MEADSYQIGGSYYKTEYEHWSLVIACGLSYFEGNTTKYITRWRKKGGATDLRKSLHYLNKMEETVTSSPKRLLTTAEILREVNAFCEANNLKDLERAYVRALCTWQIKEELDGARQFLFLLLDEAEALDKGATPAPLSDSNKHADRYGGA